MLSIKDQIIQNEPVLVFPGDRLGVIEEFQPGPYTYEENGEIRSAVLGIPRFSSKNYMIQVLPRPPTAPIPRKGDIVIGQVAHTGSQIATINIFYINGKEVFPTYTAIIHISQVSKGYISNMEDAYKSGDIIRARVVNGKTIPVQIETLESNHGVIFSRCSKCGDVLVKLGKDKLKCNSCQRTEKRKTAVDYGRAGKDIKYY